MRQALEMQEHDSYESARGERLACELALLQACLAKPVEEVRLTYRLWGAPKHGLAHPVAFSQNLEEALSVIPGFEFDSNADIRFTRHRITKITLNGIGAAPVAELLMGSHVFIDSSGQLGIGVLTRETDVGIAPPPVLRVHAPRSVADYRTGLFLSSEMSPKDLEGWTLSQLPLRLDEVNDEEADHG